MSGYDAASVVARLARLGEQGKPWTPEVLIERFCGEEADGLVAGRGTRVDGDVTTSRGWCGFNGQRSENALVSGFDDGYDFMGHLSEHGWLDLPQKGDWPYVVYMAWQTRESPTALVEYCEADFTLWQFANPEALRKHYAALREAP